MLEFTEKEIPIHDLRVGMYVCRLDIPWSETDYPLQGVLVQSEDDIVKLLGYCKRVYIDVAKSKSLENYRKYVSSPTVVKQKIAPVKTTKKPVKKLGIEKAQLPSNWKQRHCVERYKTVTSIKKELDQSREIFDSVERQVYLLCENTFRCRRANLEELVDSCSQIVESIIRNPDAFAWLCRIRETKRPIYMHIIRLAILGSVVGRQFGLNRFALTHVCYSLLMSGIGKSRMSQEVLLGYRAGKPSREYQKHLSETLYQLKEIRFHDQSVIDTLKDYCERLDGSGFPNGKSGTEISFYSQLCGLIETFELIINPYDMSRAVSPANAIVCLNRAKGILFDTSLVETFIKALGLYPTGTLVRLSNGMLGVVHSQNYEKRLRASVIPIINEHGYVLEKWKIMDLSCSDQTRLEDEQIFIVQGIPSNNIPRGLLEQAHLWIYERSSLSGKKGFIGKFF